MSRKLADYQVGLLSPYERAQVAHHLASCAACRAEMAALERTVSLLRPMPAADAPPHVWAHVARQLTPRHAVRRAAAPQRRYWVPALAAAVLLLVVGLAVVLPLVQGHGVAVPSQVAYADLQVAASWHTPLADKAALGLVLIADEDTDPLPGAQETVD